MFRLHAADLEIFERVTQLRQPFLDLIGKQWSPGQAIRLFFTEDAAGFFERLAPFLLAVVTAAEPSERQQLDRTRSLSELIASTGS